MEWKTGRCLSIQQPWAWLIATGHKEVENRSWPTNIRGWFGIHAGQKFDEDGYRFVRNSFPQILMPAPADFERGGIVGRARLTDCVQDLDSPWFFGPYGFVMADAEPLPFQPCRGKLGFFQPELAAPRQPHRASGPRRVPYREPGMTDTELLDALEHYAWRVWSVDNPKGWTIQVDAYGGPVLGEGPTVREALAQAMGKVALPARHCGECTEEMVPELVTMERCPVCGDVSYRQALTGRAE